MAQRQAEPKSVHNVGCAVRRILLLKGLFLDQPAVPSNYSSLSEVVVLTLSFQETHLQVGCCHELQYRQPNKHCTYVFRGLQSL